MRTEDDLRTALTALERHAPAAARVLPGSSRRARHGLRSPLSARWLAGITAAAALAGAVTALTLPSGSSRTIQNGGVSSPSTTTTTLKAKLLAAFSAASSEIAYERSTTTLSSGGTPMTEEIWYSPWQASAGQLVRSRHLNLTGGAPYQDVEFVYQLPAPGTVPPGLPPAIAQKVRGNRLVGVVAAMGEIIDIEYGNQTWSDQKSHALLDSDPANPQVVLDEIKQGTWKVVGHTRLGGRAAIELSWAQGGGGTSYFWVDAHSYLPLREVSRTPVGSPGKMDANITTTDYKLLPATSANLAKLTPPIPAGFRQTATQELPETGPGVG